jgi:transcriptional regulator with XRE-family HTH domain
MVNMAVATYFQVLRNHRRTPEGKRMTQAHLARAVSIFLHREVNQSTISKIETGQDAISGDLMAALLDVLGGRIEDVIWLLKNGANIEEAGQRALTTLVDEIPTENELEQLIADWQTDEQLRRSLRRVWRTRDGRATSAAEH